MKSKRQVWIAVLCLLSAIAIALAFSAHTRTVQAAKHAGSMKQGIAQPAVYLASPSLRNALLADSSALRVSVTAQRGYNPNLPEVEEFTLTPPNPGKGVTKTTLRVRFPQEAAEKLSSQIPFTLGDQEVLLQRSADSPSDFVTQVDFDWQSFAKVQQQRKELAETGRVIPVFQGRRFVRMDKIEFIDPTQVLGALQSHQSIHFTPQILEDTGLNIDPQTELMITDPNVVEDPNRTFDPCEAPPNNGTQMGAWTFGRLMLSISGQTDATNLTNIENADAMVHNLLELWANQQMVNSFPVNARMGIANVMSPNPPGNWPLDPGGVNNDIRVAPFQLNAIINRMDIGEGSSPVNAGELRLIFGWAPCSGGEGSPKLFNVIFEYNVPTSVASGCTGSNSVEAWADLWQTVENDFESCGGFSESCNPNNNPIADIQAITDKVIIVSAGAADNLAAFRSNEEALGGSGEEIWEMRQFGLTGLGGQGAPTFVQVPIFETPEGDPTAPPNTTPNFGFNTVNSMGGQGFSCENSDQGKCKDSVLTTFINGADINFPGTYQVPLNFGSGATKQPFEGGSAFQPLNPGAYWNGATGIHSNTARSEFSANTCNGCHGGETQTDFQQVVNRQPEPLGGNPAPQASTLSAFLVGCSDSGTGLEAPCASNACNLQNVLTQECANEVVQDPALQGTNTNTFVSDLTRRATYMNGVLGGNCQGDQLLRGLLQHRPNFSH